MRLILLVTLLLSLLVSSCTTSLGSIVESKSVFSISEIEASHEEIDHSLTLSLFVLFANNSTSFNVPFLQNDYQFDQFIINQNKINQKTSSGLSPPINS